MNRYEFVVEGGKHDAGDFKRLHFTLPALDRETDRTRDPEPSPAQINAIVKCVTTVQLLLDQICTYSTQDLRQTSNLTYVRLLYAIIFLLKTTYKIHYTQLGDYLTVESLKVDIYMDLISRKMAGAADNGRFRIPTHWQNIVELRAKPWYQELRRRMIQENQPPTFVEQLPEVRPDSGVGHQDEQRVTFESSMPPTASSEQGSTEQSPEYSSAHIDPSLASTNWNTPGSIPGHSQPQDSTFVPRTYGPEDVTLDFGQIPMDLSGDIFGINRMETGMGGFVPWTNDFYNGRGF
jgi:hypothetical protein